MKFEQGGRGHLQLATRTQVFLHHRSADLNESRRSRKIGWNPRLEQIVERASLDQRVAHNGEGID